MKLTYFTVSNYRSITNAYKLDLKNITVMLGKNNVGKSNLIKALNLSMEIIRFTAKTGGKRVFHQLYSWREDFPVALQNKRKLKNKDTEFRLDFQLDEAEINDFYNVVGSSINGSLSIYIKIKQDETLSITVPKRGKNATALTSKIKDISKFICDNIYIQYIPAIRSEADAYDVISNIVEEELQQTNDDEYQRAQAYIEEYRSKKLRELSMQIKEPLAIFMPNVKSVNLSIEERFSRRGFMSNKNLRVDIDDGVLTSLSQKGDGVKSLTTMAILSKTTSQNRVIIIDEPEAHLHPEAIHYLRKVLYELADNNQIIISTHNPIFVNRCTTSSNIIVENGQANAATRVEQIRKTLGVKLSDNLVYSDYVIVVEGPSDKIVLERFLQREQDLSDMIRNNAITVRSIGGVNNLKAELYNLEQHLCNYLVVLDFDDAGKNKAREVQEYLNLSNEQFRYFSLSNYRECELEELYSPELYKQYLLAEYQVDIDNGRFQNKSKKWSKRVEELASLAGNELNEAQINDIKTDLSNMCSGISIEECFREEAIPLLNGICAKIKTDVNRLFSYSED